MIMDNRKIKVGLVQINNSFSGQNYLPLSVGMLQAYAEKNLKSIDRYQFLLPVYKRCRVEDAVEALKEAGIVLFSVYVWNIRISLEIARRLKAEKPQTFIVFGGPQVPDHPEDFLKEHTFIDLTVHGEGEAVATQILDIFPSQTWKDVPSVSYRNEEGKIVQNPRAGRINNLGESLPSPYLKDTFAPLMKANPNEKWIVLWETNRGCPFSCTFCDWGSATQAKVYPFDIERLYGEIDWFVRHKIEFIFCCDANFGILPRDVEIVQRVAEKKKTNGYPHALSVQNTKNVTDRAYTVQKILADAGLNKGVAIALQSVDPETLKSIKRANISTESFKELQRRFTRDNVETYSDVILALPGETYETYADGVASIIDNGQHNRIQFNNLSVLPNAEMGDPAYQKKYGMEIVKNKIINVHGSLQESPEEIYEIQEMVIATAAMPRKDWVRARAFSWMAGFLHFDKIMQIPFLLMHEIAGANYREMVELFSETKHADCPVISEMQQFFRDKALDIQGGGPEFCSSVEWLNMWWPADEYMLIKLTKEDKLQQFYAEAEKVLTRFLKQKSMPLQPEVLHEAIVLNQSLIKLPFQKENLTLTLKHNLWEFYQSALRGNPASLPEGAYTYRVDRTSQTWTNWDDWCREVVWYGHRRGAYLYGNNSIETEIAGHH